MARQTERQPTLPGLGTTAALAAVADPESVEAEKPQAVEVIADGKTEPVA